MNLRDVVQHFLSDCRVRGRTEATLTSYTQRLGVLVQVLSSLFCITDVEQVKVMHLRKCVEYMMSPEFPSLGGKARVSGLLAPSSIRAYVLVFKVFFHWCYQEELIESNPTARLSVPKMPFHVKPTLTFSHIEKMLEACDQRTDIGYRDYAMLLLLFDTGMRRSEICGLRLADVHETYVKVYGKGRKEREIGIHPETAKVLWKYIHRHRHPKNANEPALFLTRYGDRALTSDSIWDVIKRVQEAAGLGDVKIAPHVFRHTFAKMYLEHGGEVFKLSREMGHSSVQVTEVYLKDFTSTEARKEHTSFSPVQGIRLRKNRRH